MIPLERAKETAAEVLELLRPYFERIEVAGSLRRRRPQVFDIDLVAIPRVEVDPRAAINMLPVEIVRNGPKLAGFLYKGASIDIYYATEQTWGTLLLIRTGSKEHNVFLCNRARARGWKLKANGEGLFDSGGTRIAGDTEESIFLALGVAYKEPWERNQPTSDWRFYRQGGNKH